MSETYASTALVVGENAKAIRERNGITIADVAANVKAYGLGWSDSRVSAFERGKVTLTPGVLYIVAGVLGKLTGAPLSVADLFPATVDLVWLTEGNLAVSGEELRAAMVGRAVSLPARGIDLDKLVEAAQLAHQAAQRPHNQPASAAEQMALFTLFEAQHKLSRADLKVLEAVADDLTVGLIAALRLWGRTPLSERDRRAPDDANPQKLGRISRELIAELREELGQDDGR